MLAVRITLAEKIPSSPIPRNSRSRSSNDHLLHTDDKNLPFSLEMEMMNNTCFMPTELKETTFTCVILFSVDKIFDLFV